VLSALAALAAGDRLGLTATGVCQAIEEFAGVSRDFECRGSYRGVTLIDDEGGDPAAVAAALRLGRRAFGDRRIWAALDASAAADPRAAGRLVAALEPADAVLLASGRPSPTSSVPVPDRARSDPSRTPSGRSVPAGMPPSPSSFGTEDDPPPAAEALARALAAAGKRARRVSCLDDAILELDRHLEPGDVLVTLGAGEVGMISDAFIRRLPRDRPGR
jgi:UDP-N-acetylmuramate--alanine ligase